MPEFLPLFLNLTGRQVLLVGGGPVAASKLTQLRAVGAVVRVVSPEVVDAILQSGVHIERRAFIESDVNNVWLVVAAAPPEVNRAVSAAASARHVFVNAVDDPPNATAYLGGVLRRGGLTVAISSEGRAPALTGLVREALDAVLPDDVSEWMAIADRERAHWKRSGVPMSDRRPLLLDALNALYAKRSDPSPANRARQDEGVDCGDRAQLEAGETVDP